MKIEDFEGGKDGNGENNDDDDERRRARTAKKNNDKDKKFVWQHLRLNETTAIEAAAAATARIQQYTTKVTGR